MSLFCSFNGEIEIGPRFACRPGNNKLPGFADGLRMHVAHAFSTQPGGLQLCLSLYFLSVQHLKSSQRRELRTIFVLSRAFSLLWYFTWPSRLCWCFKKCLLPWYILFLSFFSLRFLVNDMSQRLFIVPGSNGYYLSLYLTNTLDIWINTRRVSIKSKSWPPFERSSRETLDRLKLSPFFANELCFVPFSTGTLLGVWVAIFKDIA